MNFCEKCGRSLKPGQLKYQLRIELVSMFDGVLPEPDEDLDQELEKLIEAVSRQDPQDVARDVAQSMALIICRRCRNDLVKAYAPKSRTFH